MSLKLSYITINTDASFNYEKKVGGYAFWIRSNHFTIKKSDSFNRDPKDSLEAEIMAIGNAIYTLINLPTLPHIDNIVINCDCIPAIQNIRLNSNNKIGKETAQYLETLKHKIRDITGRSPETIFKHVKGHQKGKLDKRSYVNCWCDEESRNKMRLKAKTK